MTLTLDGREGGRDDVVFFLYIGMSVTTISLIYLGVSWYVDCYGLHLLARAHHLGFKPTEHRLNSFTWQCAGKCHCKYCDCQHSEEQPTLRFLAVKPDGVVDANPLSKIQTECENQPYQYYSYRNQPGGKSQARFPWHWCRRLHGSCCEYGVVTRQTRAARTEFSNTTSIGPVAFKFY